MRISRDAWVLIVVIAVAVILLTLFDFAPEQESKVPTTYNAGRQGVKAFYTLLGDRLGNNVDRLFEPYTNLPPETAVLIVVAPLEATPIETEESNALDAWIRAGGTAIFVSDSLRGVPARFSTTRRLGKGYVYAFDSLKVISNAGMRDYRNAIKMVDLIGKHTRPATLRGRRPPESSEAGDLILFDEYHHGLGGSRKLAAIAHLPGQIKIGAVIVLVGIAALCYGRGRRFGAVRRLPSWETRRPGFEFVESVAGLYARAGATDVAADILAGSLRQEICARLGLAPDSPAADIVRRLNSDGRTETAARVDRLLASAQAGQRIGKSELVYIAREIHAVEEELGLGGIVA